MLTMSFVRRTTSAVSRCSDMYWTNTTTQCVNDDDLFWQWRHFFSFLTTPTTTRCLHLQTATLLPTNSTKQLCMTSSWCRHLVYWMKHMRCLRCRPILSIASKHATHKTEVHNVKWLVTASGTVCRLTLPQRKRWLFFGITSKLSFSPDHFLTNCFPFLVLYAVYCSGLAVLYLGPSK